jgi:hypothetical protein
MKMVKTQKRAILAIGVVSVAVVLVALMAYPIGAANAQADFQYALNQENWVVAEDFEEDFDVTLSSGFTVKIEAKGYAFMRIDEETIKQYECATSIVVQVQPATETEKRTIDVTGSVVVNDVTYTIAGGKVFLRRDKRSMFMSCTGTDESGNQIDLKFGARYFWWGGKAYALRSKALLQTQDKPMLLLQRGIARII